MLYHKASRTRRASGSVFVIREKLPECDTGAEGEWTSGHHALLLQQRGVEQRRCEVCPIPALVCRRCHSGAQVRKCKQRIDNTGAPASASRSYGPGAICASANAAAEHSGDSGDLVHLRGCVAAQTLRIVWIHGVDLVSRNPRAIRPGAPKCLATVYCYSSSLSNEFRRVSMAGVRKRGESRP
jgi:hypothetical protein